MLVRLGAIFSLLALLSLSACSTTPLITGFPATGVGRGAGEFYLGFQGYSINRGSPYVASAAVRARYGVTDDLDFIAATDFNTLTTLVKLAVFNDLTPARLTIAPLAGVAFAFNDQSYVVGLVTSLRFGAFEPYGLVRWQRVSVDISSLDYTVLKYPPNERFSFPSYAFGFLWGLGERGRFGAEVVLLGRPTNNEFKLTPLVNLQFGFRLF